MEMSGTRRLSVPQFEAWNALNDPEVLKLCIPGCDRMEADGPNQYAIGMAVRIGPVAARFNGKITQTDVLPPESYTLSFEGQGGAAGFGKGVAKVSLSQSGDASGCDLHYTANAQVGGKIAQMGQRLIDGVARSMADDFFKRFETEMASRPPKEALPDPAQAPLTPPAPRGVPVWAWWLASAAVLAALAIILLRT